MPCVCERCVRHLQALGITRPPSSRAAIHKAFRAAARICHPDRFEREPVKRSEAEEVFKNIQIAYRELIEHCENPVEWPTESSFTPDNNSRTEPPRSFHGMPGYCVPPNFPPIAEDIIAEHVKEPDRALAIVDLSGAASPPGSFSRFIILTEHGIFVRDALNLLSLLWYVDLGDLRLIDQRRNGKPRSCFITSSRRS